MSCDTDDTIKRSCGLFFIGFFSVVGTIIEEIVATAKAFLLVDQFCEVTILTVG